MLDQQPREQDLWLCGLTIVLAQKWLTCSCLTNIYHPEPLVSLFSGFVFYQVTSDKTVFFLLILGQKFLLSSCVVIFLYKQVSIL